MNYAPATPLHEGIGSYVADDVGGAVHVRVEVPPVCRPIPSPFDAPAAEARLISSRGIVDGQRISIQEAGRAGVTLLGDNDADAHQLSLVGPHRDETGMRNGHELLIGAPPQMHL